MKAIGEFIISVLCILVGIPAVSCAIIVMCVAGLALCVLVGMGAILAMLTVWVIELGENISQRWRDCKSIIR